MKTYKLLSDLLPVIKGYEDLYPERECYDLKDFAAFLVEYAREQEHDPEPQRAMHPAPNAIDAIIAQDLSYLFRYMRWYFKKALRDSVLLTLDEYTYLVCLLRHPVMTKTELNNINVMEKTSGAEVINRLLKNELISQRVNEGDRRSYYVSITEKGKAELMKLFPKLQLAVRVLFAPLNEEQKRVLHSLHQLLDEHNRLLFLEHHNETLEELILSMRRER